MINLKKKEWDININDKSYKIEFIPNIFFKFKFKIYINGELKNDVKCKLGKIGADYYFSIDTYKCAVIMRVSNMKSEYDLAVDGISVNNNASVYLL